MSFMTLFHSFDLPPQRAGLVRQLLLVGAALLLAGSSLAQTPTKRAKSSASQIVSDGVRLAGSKITGGWRETAADGSWRRVEFVLDRDSASVTFGDGERGRRPPGAARYSYAGAGIKGEKETYTEAHSFAGASPALLARASQSSPIPKGIATRIDELGGDFRLLQRVMDESHRMKELGSAFDAARRPSDEGGVFGKRPGGSPGEGKWSDPRRGVGRDGRASESPESAPPPIDEFPETTDADGNRSSTRVTRHGDGSTTTVFSWNDADGSAGVSRTEKDAHGNVTGGSGESTSANGAMRTSEWTRDPKTGEVQAKITFTHPDGSGIQYTDRHRGTPPETGSSRGGFDEAWMYKAAPWFMDALYTNWKRENDLVKSGGRIAQPGRGEDSSQAPVESSRVGVDAVVNCGDTGTNPCARAEGTETDTRGRLGALTQPPRDVPSGGPLGGSVTPFPVPSPPQFQK
jgi:hypothetical protein